MSQGNRDGRQVRWDAHKEERRQQIIDAAIAVVEESTPGTEVHVQQIAARAGLSRTVIYRHFADRADLDRAVRLRIVEQVWELLLPRVSLDGTAPEIIERVVGSYIGWAVAHPALHRLADHDNSGSDGPLEAGLERIASRVSAVIGTALMAFGAELSEEEAAAIDPFVYGIVGSVFSSVRRWVGRPDPALSAAGLTELVSRSVWFVIDGHARTLGVEIDPTRCVEDLLADAMMA
ncbi:TetR/AcrR family transcriptional regulator [Nocardioides sp.]|uniref:TetR/AcrR family transcriptional regulator n=1 Tax=Nocardioides sp. TaxID=35761 RepID=UPI0039E39E97